VINLPACLETHSTNPLPTCLPVGIHKNTLSKLNESVAKKRVIAEVLTQRKEEKEKAEDEQAEKEFKEQERKRKESREKQKEAEARKATEKKRAMKNALKEEKTSKKGKVVRK
jgi:hypothetical protein